MQGQMSISDFLNSEINKIEEVKEKVYSKDTFVTIRSENMEVIKERNFIEPCDDSRILIYATVKLLKGNMVYFSNWYTYHFLEKFKTEEEAEKEYKKKAEKIIEELYEYKRFEVNIPSELKDMYLCQNDRWSEYGYVVHNGPVIAPKNKFIKEIF